jgi:tryptophan-rich sensory protein
MAIGAVLWIGLVIYVVTAIWATTFVLVFSEKAVKKGKDSGTRPNRVFYRYFYTFGWMVALPCLGVGTYLVWMSDIGEEDIGGLYYLIDRSPFLNLSMYDAVLALHVIELSLIVAWPYLYFKGERPVLSLTLIVVCFAVSLSATVCAYFFNVGGGILFTIYTIWIGVITCANVYTVWEANNAE